MLQRFLSQEALRQARAVRLMPAGVRGPPCCRVLRSTSQPTAHHHRGLSTSDSGSKAAAALRAKDERHRPSPTVPRPEVGPRRSPGSSTPGSQEAAGSVRPRDGNEASSPRSPTPPGGNSPPPCHDTSSLGLFQRFKKTFQQYGKVMVPVHVVTSSIWMGVFYCAATQGVNVVPFLEFVGLPDSILNFLRHHSSGGYLITAWALCKIITPVRYIVTLGGTKLIVRYLRRRGYMSKPPTVKEYFKERRDRKDSPV